MPQGSGRTTSHCCAAIVSGARERTAVGGKHGCKNEDGATANFRNRRGSQGWRQNWHGTTAPDIGPAPRTKKGRGMPRRQKGKKAAGIAEAREEAAPAVRLSNGKRPAAANGVCGAFLGTG